ncbi:MAG: Ig-like domain-containing protein, partial [Candidatus Poribacteria bacterium]|nr:Ig-like domain-containing protein [Candidatus Poribacteria bacterium]
VAVQRSANNPITMPASDPDNDPLFFTIVAPPSSGKISVSGNIAFYTPDPSFSGEDSFTFKTSDGLVESNTSTANIRVDSIKEELVDTAKLATEGQTTEIHLEEGKVEIELPPASDPSIGKIAVGIAKSDFTEMTSAASKAEKEVAAREIVNQLKADFADELGSVSTGSQAEEEIKTHLKRAQGAMLKIEVKTATNAKMRDFSRKPLQIRVPRRGGATAIVLADANGSELIPTRVEGDILIGTITHLSLVFTVVNNEPTAEDKSISLTEDSSASVTLAGTDADGDPITYTIVGSPGKGGLSGTAPNLTYTPNSNYNGTDSFTYVTNDGAVDSVAAMVSISIAASNDVPSAFSQTVSTEEDKAISITLNGSDPDGDTIAYSIVDQPTNGALSGTTPNMTYTPNANYNGTDSFTFDTGDGSGAYSQKGIVTVNVSSINDIPELSPLGNISLGEDADDQTIELTASDSDGDALTYAITNSNTDLVTATIEGNKLTLGLQSDQNGSGSFTVTVKDQNGGSDSQTFSLTVSAVNDAPLATAASLETAEDQALEITLAATDVDSEDLTYSLVDTSSNGQLSTIADGKLTYTPVANYHGTDSFTFQAKDAELSSETATIDITITSVNDLPVAAGQSGEQRVEFTTLTAEITLSGEDVDGDRLSYVIVDSPQHGQLSGEAPSLTYTPGNSFTGADQFTFKVNDGTVDSEVATVDIVRPFLPFKFEVPTGISLIHLPLKVKFINGQPQEIETVGDLYDVLGSDNVNFLITYYKETGSWSSYLGPKNRGFRADQAITPDLGIIAVMKQAVILDILGDPLLVEGTAEIQLQRGLNLIGVPVKDERITRAGDLLSLPGFADNVTAMIIPSEGTFKVLARAGDPGDFELTGAESIIVTAKAEVVVSLTGTGWSRIDSQEPVLVAPSIVSQAEGFTPVLAALGQLTTEASDFRPDTTRVWVQNLSTGFSLSQSVTDGSYQLTLVDADADGVARIGDLLEIGGETGQQRFRIKPYQHQVTEQDINQGWIQLPDLVAREIPAETQLLPNYPNPFNPETWIPFDLAEDAPVEIEIYSEKGTLVRRLPLGYTDAGIYRQQDKAAYWDGRNANGEQIASGVYFYRIQAGDYNQIRKMVILK